MFIQDIADSDKIVEFGSITCNLLEIVSMIGGVRVSWAVHILHPSRKVTIYSLTVRIFFAESSRVNGHTELRV